jgi:hypothetical protein
MSAIAERLLGEINSKEDLTLRLGDALDVKASIGLALILFLATQSAYFLDKGDLPRIGIWMQLGSIFCIVCAASFALKELWPRRYDLPEPESNYIPKRIEQLTQHYGAYPDVAANVTEAFTNDEIEWAKKRIAANQKKNWKKSNSLNLSFWFTLATVILNLLTLLMFLKPVTTFVSAIF